MTTTIMTTATQNGNCYDIDHIPISQVHCLRLNIGWAHSTVGPLHLKHWGAHPAPHDRRLCTRGLWGQRGLAANHTCLVRCLCPTGRMADFHTVHGPVEVEIPRCWCSSVYNDNSLSKTRSIFHRFHRSQQCQRLSWHEQAHRLRRHITPTISDNTQLT